MIDADRWLRRLWLVNGVALLLLLVVGVGMLAFYGISSLFGSHGGDAISVAGSEATPAGERTPRAVRFTTPEGLRGSAARIVFVEHGTAQMSPAAADSYSGSGFVKGSGSEGSTRVNVLFLRPDGSGQLLFHEPVLVEEVNYPGDEGTARDTTYPRRAWITYKVIQKDGNGNGRLDDEDQAALLVSDLEGGRLRPVLPDRYWPEDVVPIGDGSRMLVYALEPQAPRDQQARERMRQRAFLYDPQTDRLTVYTALDSLTAEAGRVMAR